MTNDQRREQLLSRLLDLAAPNIAKGQLPLFKAFLSSFYSRQAPDDLLSRPQETLFALALNVWETSKNRKPSTPTVRVLSPKDKAVTWNTKHTVIQIINDDMPFLVDSVIASFAVTLNYRVHMMHHPILEVIRDTKGKLTTVEEQHGQNPDACRESCMYVEVDAQSDPQVLTEIKETVETTLADVRVAVTDWRAMMAKIDETVASLTVNAPSVSEEEVEETIRFLRWLAQDNFTFLGFREYHIAAKGDTLEIDRVEGSGLGILRDPARNVLRDKKGLTPMSPEIKHFLNQPDPLIITKANVKATVHRTAHMDYIGVKTFDEKGNAVGERRFVGLFTSLSYRQFAHDVPLLRHKVAKIITQAGFPKRSYAAKALKHIIETFPRDELFQINEQQLFETSMGVLHLTERPKARAFIRQDQFERFVSALVYVPKEAYQAGIRVAISDILCDAFNGEISVYYAMLSEATLARWHFIIRTQPGEVPKVDLDAINKKIFEAAQGWADQLHKSLVDRYGEEQGSRLHHTYKSRFDVAYRDAFTAAQAAYDVSKLAELGDDNNLRVDFYRHLADGEHGFRMKVYHAGRVITLSECLPVLENMGFRVLSEHTYKLQTDPQAHIHDFALERTGGTAIALDILKSLVETLFVKVCRNTVENDRFNELAITAGLSWDQIVVLRAYGKYLRQLGLGFSPDYMAATMVEHRTVSSQLYHLFQTMFDPQLGPQDESTALEPIKAALYSELESVTSLDQDRIIRAYIHAIMATQRTNFFQPGVIEGAGETAFAVKIHSRDLNEAPLPRPYAEIWVYSPKVEGVHLRGGPVARGGLRWSDRKEDFRTEVLGLVKAQQVKNAVIVPQGAKGGFLPKQLPPASDREAFMAEGVASYRSFITSLLSLTDNLVKGKIAPPEDIIRRDGDDPYLVVAADKGTATFSDIANSISEGNNFWLGDAFASGGSHGYDHKKMGITAKGGWVSVQRHFREIGINVQTDPITVIGVGDMAGDVFGNGMLLSKAIKLRAAFNHMHIFLDPDPQDTQACWAERKRLFEMPRSSWADYDSGLISEGGGVFERSAKSITLSPEIKTWLGLKEDSITPTALIHLLLKAEADLLWFGGIGTYVRSSDESNQQVGDRTNDNLRVTATDLKVKAVGEGANLGMTQKARIEFARLGGRLNTDFIDNSAGVDCSDKEVNIKILLSDAVASGKLKRDDRDKLLETMTDEVSEIVLSDNYLQTQAISLAEAQAVQAREYHLGLVRTLERSAGLNREIEYLPSDEGFAELATNGQGLTRPEIATLMAYAKISLLDILTLSKLVDDPVLLPELEWGFPTALRNDYSDELQRHRLKREIIATVLANEVVNWAGLTFVYEVKEETGLGVEDIIAAFVVVREVFGLKKQWKAINALDYEVDAKVQYDMHQSVTEALKSQVLWLLRNLSQPFNVSAIVERFKKPVDDLFNIKQNILSKPAQEVFVRRMKKLEKQGVNHELANFVADFEALTSGLDIIAVAEQTGKPVDYVASVHFALGNILGFDWLHQRADSIKANDHWDTLAIRSLQEDLADQRRALVEHVCSNYGSNGAQKATKDWATEQQTRIIRVEALIDDLKTSGSLGVAKLSFAARHLRSILR